MPKPIAYKTGSIQPPNTARQSNILVGVGKLVFGGGANVNGTYSKEGSVDIAIYRFYNKVLTQSEITQNYNTNKTQFGLQ